MFKIHNEVRRLSANEKLQYKNEGYITGLPVFADKAKAYVVKLQSGDKDCRKLWQKFINISIAHSEAIYRDLNVTLKSNDIRPESSYNDDLDNILNDLKHKNLAVEDQGAQVVFLDELADKIVKTNNINNIDFVSSVS